MLITDETAVAETKSKKVSAITVAILVHVALGVLFAFIAVSLKKDAEPEIVAAVITPSTKNEPKMEKKTVMKQVRQTSAASAASPIARMIRSNTTAKIAAPEVTKVSDGPLGLGEGDFGDGFGSGSGSGGGMGSGATFFGSRSGGPLVGTLYDMKQDRNAKEQSYDEKPGPYFDRINSVIKKRFSESSLNDYYQAKNKLGFNFLMIPYMSADEGPKAFQAEKEIQPRGWFVHYSGTVAAPEPGMWRFSGCFDDCLMVIVNGKMVLDASWDDSTKDADIRNLVTAPRFFAPKPIYAGSWVRLDGNFQIDIIVGERPGGKLGGTLLVEKKDESYDKRSDGSPILPVFSTVKLSAGDIKRLKESGYDFDPSPPVFSTRSTASL